MLVAGFNPRPLWTERPLLAAAAAVASALRCQPEGDGSTLNVSGPLIAVIRLDKLTQRQLL
jgi:hypothetical protein